MTCKPSPSALKCASPHALQCAAPARGERGTALVVALLFLIIISMLGLSSMTTTTLEEKMSSNSRDQNLAMQAAEAALRDAERDLANTSITTRVITTGLFVAGCTNALCTQGAALTNLDGTLTSAFYGQFTGASGTLSFQGVGAQPRYMIELLTALPPQTPVPPVGEAVRNFRITAKGYGNNINTVVILQTVYQLTLP